MKKTYFVHVTETNKGLLTVKATNDKDAFNIALDMLKANKATWANTDWSIDHIATHEDE